jgi:C-terminal processing protease CtpA/Prc
MKTWKFLLPATAILLFAGQAAAQSEKDEEAREMAVQKAEYAERYREAEERIVVAQSEVAEREEEMATRQAEYSVRLREAEERMEAAARQIAEISQESLPHLIEIKRRFEFSNTPRIGITIDGSESSGSVEGIAVEGVTPESAADDAGLRAGDVITAVNGEPMNAESSADANKLLLDFMHGVEEGDELKVDYLRNGKTGSVQLSPRVAEMHAFSWYSDGDDFDVEGIPDVPHLMNELQFATGFRFPGSAWSRMELVELGEGLGKYFGTNTGLLVVSAPDDDGLELQAGDVIQTIDGREPKDVRHAMRILGSYQDGEKLKLGIMRDKKKLTLDVEVPANHRGALFAPPAVKPVRAPAPTRPALERTST